MKKLISLVVLLLALIHCYSQNLIVNPGFESGLTGWYYACVSGSPAVFSIDNSDFHEGTASLFVHTQPGDSAYLAQEVTVTAGKTYLFTWWLRADSMEHYMLPFLRVRQDTISKFDSYFLPNGNTQGWVKQEARILIPDSTDNIVLFFGLFGGGRIHYDAFSFAEETDTSWISWSVDLGSTLPPFKKLFSSNGIGPGNISQPYNHVQKFQFLGIDYIRTHDYAIAFDHSVIFPDTTRDPLDSTAYYWHTTDSVMADIYAAGGKVFYRFGQSYDLSHTFNAPPANMDKWAQVCVQILKHYREGWANGFSYDVDYAEIWNEPDLWDFWTGTSQDYIRLYRKAALAIRQYDPSIHVGGPAISNIFNESFINEFIDSVAAYSLPLDFLSYHLYYFHNPYGFLQTNELARSKLDAAGLTGVELINSEWNSYMFSWETPSDWGMDDAFNAASVVGAMTYMQESSIGKFFRYALDNYWFGMIDWYDQWRHSGLAMLYLREVMDNGNRLSTTGNDSLGTVAMASMSPAGDAIRVIVAANSGSSTGYRINFLNPDPSLIYVCDRYCIDEQNFGALTDMCFFTWQNPYLEVQATAPFTEFWIINTMVNSEYNNTDSRIFAYPNPFYSDIHLILPNDSGCEGKLKVYDSTGRIVHQQQMNDIGKNIIINPGNLEPGVYIIEVEETGKGKMIVPVIRGQ
ncbi:MAG: T9SS type A sorting domain-containing protein, partial [Bacteroidota bacterium]